MNVGRRVISFAVATTLAVAPLGCRKEEEKATPSDSGSADEPAKGEPADPAKAGDPVPEKKPIVEAPADPSGFGDPAVSYPAALDDLLGLVPDGESTFVVVRDPSALMSLFGTFVADQVKGLAPLAKVAEPEVGAKLEESAAIYAKLGAELAKGVIDLDKGVVVIDTADAVIYGANDPNALPNLLRALGAEKVPNSCAALAAAPGYAVCGDDEAKVKALAPGKKAAELRTALGAALPGFDLERGNFVGRFVEDKQVHFAVATPPGSVHAAIGLADVMGEQAEILGVGKPTALGLADPGSAFAWAKLDPSKLEPALQAMGPPMNTVGATFGGEIYFGGVTGGVPMAFLLGVSDPSPAAGLVSLASLALDQVPKELPDGTKVDVKVTTVQAGSKDVQTLHGKLSGSKNVEKLAELGVLAEGYAFSAGKFAGAVVGSNDAAVKTIAQFEGSGPSQALLERLPPALARVLNEGTATWAVHLPLDGLQSPQMQSQLTEGIAMLPERERSGLEPDAFSNALLSMVAPLSSVSAWMTHPENARVLHVSVEGFADDSTAKGKAAREAVAKVTVGEDRKATYAALAQQFDDPRFKARTGEDPTALRSAVSGAFMFLSLFALTARAQPAMEESVVMPSTPPAAPEPPPAPDDPMR